MHERFGEGPRQRRRHRGGRRLGGIGQQDRELAATEPDHRAGCAGAGAAEQALGDEPQHRVAGPAPEDVVDLLEAVEVEDQHGSRPVARQEAVEAAAQDRPVGQPGERVEPGEAPEILLGGAPGEHGPCSSRWSRTSADTSRKARRSALGKAARGRGSAIRRTPSACPSGACSATAAVKRKPGPRPRRRLAAASRTTSTPSSPRPRSSRAAVAGRAGPCAARTARPSGPESDTTTVGTSNSRAASASRRDSAGREAGPPVAPSPGSGGAACSGGAMSASDTDWSPVREQTNRGRVGLAPVR